MKDKTTSLHSTFSINGEISNDDTRFLSITIDVLHTGKNLNKSYFDKDVVDSCVDSIKNTPVLGFIKYNSITKESDFKGHEYILTKTENGIEEKYIGSAYGIVPESCNPRWIMKMCSDGQEREFLQVDALLWTKFDDSASIIERDGDKSQSMELEVASVEGCEDDNGIFHFEKFRFDGCCILGDGVQPAMVDANVTLKEVRFAASDFAKSVQSELNDKFSIFQKLIDDENNQGGVSDMTETNTDFAQTVMEQLEDISIMVSQYETMETCWGEAPRFYMADIQENEVIAVDRQDCYRYYGFPFSLSGDKPEIDFSNGVRKKIRYENYEEGTSTPEGVFDFGKHIADMEKDAFSKIDEAEAKVADAEAKVEEVESKFAEVEQSKADVEAEYAQIKAEYEEIKPKYDEYVQAEEQREIDELNAQKDAKFAEYENSLSEHAEFAALKEKKDEMSVKDIENECAVLFWKMNRSKNSFSAEGSNSAVLGVIGDTDDVADGYIHTKYGNVRIGR